MDISGIFRDMSIALDLRAFMVLRKIANLKTKVVLFSTNSRKVLIQSKISVNWNISAKVKELCKVGTSRYLFADLLSLKSTSWNLFYGFTIIITKQQMSM